MGKLVTIYGGSGFVGRYIARRMAQAGWRVRVAVRRPNEALFVQALRHARSGRTGVLQHPRRCLGARRDDGRGCGGELRRHPERRGQNSALTPCRPKGPPASPASRPRKAWRIWCICRPSAPIPTAPANMPAPRPPARRCWPPSRARDPAPLVIFGPEDSSSTALPGWRGWGRSCLSSGPHAVPAGLCGRCRAGRRHGRHRAAAPGCL
jgi:hypothetical protein